MRKKIRFPVAVTFDTNGNGFHPHLLDDGWPGWFAFNQNELDQLVEYLKLKYELANEDICVFELIHNE